MKILDFGNCKIWLELQNIIFPNEKETLVESIEASTSEEQTPEYLLYMGGVYTLGSWPKETYNLRTFPNDKLLVYHPINEVIDQIKAMNGVNEEALKFVKDYLKMKHLEVLVCQEEQQKEQQKELTKISIELSAIRDELREIRRNVL